MSVPPGTAAQHVPRALLGVLALLTLWSSPAAAQRPASSGAAALSESSADDAGDAAAAGESADGSDAGAGAVAPPSDVEVIRIKGRSVIGIQTDVPDSVTQFDAAEIEALGAQNISDLAKVTPNVEIKTAGATAPTFFIRGVGLSDFSSNAAGAVAIYQDDVAINAPAIQLGTLFDLENVEVLRGPQGTGSGRNASAGAIKVYSRRPTGELTAELRSTVGRFQLKDFEGALEAPLVDEVLATRLSFRFTERDPYVDNGCGAIPVPLEERLADPASWSGVKFCDETASLFVNNPDFPPPPILFQLSQVPAGLPTKLNDIGNWAARGQLRFQPPGAEMDWLLLLRGSRTDQLSTVGQAIGTKGGVFGGQTAGQYWEPDQLEMRNTLLAQGVPISVAREIVATELAENLDIRPFRGDYSRAGPTRLDSWGTSLRGDWTVGSVNFTSISAFDTYDRFRVEDQDFTADILFESVSSDEAWQFFQELRLDGELADFPFRWETGGYYLMERLDTQVDSDFAFGSDFARRVFEQDLYSFAVYASFGWDFLDDFTLEGGVRFNWDRKDFDFELSRPANPGRTSIESRVWSAPTGTISLTYRFNDDVSAYWKYSRGWKPGTYNSSAQTARAVEPAEPETIDAWEVGLRGQWLEGRLALGAALFYYDYTDYQIFVVEDEVGAPPTLQIVNANSAEVYGAELDLRAEPLVGLVPELLEGLVLTGRLGWLESQFLEFSNEVVRNIIGFGPIPVTVDFTGNTLINSPRFKASLAADWTFDLGRWGALIPRYDFAWSDDIFFDATEGRGSPDVRGNTVLPEFAVGQPAFWLHNLRLAYRLPDGNIEIAGWIRNLKNKVHKTYAFDASTFSNVVINYVGEPRTWGVDLTIRW